MAENKQLGKYLSSGITCRTVSRIFRLKPVQRARKFMSRVQPKILELPGLCHHHHQHYDYDHLCRHVNDVAEGDFNDAVIVLVQILEQ